MAAGEDRRIAQPRSAPAWRPLIEAEGELGEKNQLTLPKTIVQALNPRPGDRFVLRVQDDGAESIVMYPLRASYAGALKGLYGGPEETAAYIRAEQDAWGE